MREFVIHTRDGRPSWLAIFIPGMALFMFGVLTLVLPQLLVALVAAIFMSVGLLLAGIGWRLRQGGSLGQSFTWLRFFDRPQ